MKLAEGYLLREISGVAVVFPVGQNAADYRYILSLNDTGRFIVERLEEETDYDAILQAMAEEYGAASDEMWILKRDLDGFLNRLRERQMLME